MAERIDEQLRLRATLASIAPGTPLRDGVNTFRTFVEAWYAGGFQKIIFHPAPNKDIREMICAILAGYAWDKSNPYVAESRRRLAVLEQVCAD